MIRKHNTRYIEDPNIAAEQVVKARIGSYASSCGGQITEEDFLTHEAEWLAAGNGLVAPDRVRQMAEGYIIGDSRQFVRDTGQYPSFTERERVAKEKAAQRAERAWGRRKPGCPLTNREIKIAEKTLPWFNKSEPASPHWREIEVVARELDSKPSTVRTMFSRFVRLGLLEKGEARGYLLGPKKLDDLL